MTEYKVESRDLEALTKRMQAFPSQLKRVQDVGMKASLNVLWENVPQYPSQPPSSSYIRTGTLGRTLGSSEQGGKAGANPQIFQVRKLGSSEVEGRFGTRLNYAEYVIGENQARQNSHWWKLSDILPKAQEKVVAIWNGIAEKLADFLESKSSGELGK